MDKGGTFASDSPLGERIRLHLKDGRGLNRGEEGQFAAAQFFSQWMSVAAIG
jgi:hypothetical protein